MEIAENTTGNDIQYKTRCLSEVISVWNEESLEAAAHRDWQSCTDEAN